VCIAGPAGGALQPGPPAPERGVVDPRRCDLRQEEPGSPLPFDLPVEVVEPLGGSPPWVVLCPAIHRVGRVQDEGSRSVGMGGGEQHRDRPGLGEHEERCRPRVHSVQHVEDVVDLLLHRGIVLRPIGEPRPSRIDHDQPREGRQATQEPREARLLPVVVDVREQPRDEHEVDRPAADHLIGDVDIAALRVLNPRTVHRPTVSRPARGAATPPARGIVPTITAIGRTEPLMLVRSSRRVSRGVVGATMRRASAPATPRLVGRGCRWGDRTAPSTVYVARTANPRQPQSE
jgi:hypothetical protein